MDLENPRPRGAPPPTLSEDIYAAVLDAAEIGAWEWHFREDRVFYYGKQWQIMGFERPRPEWRLTDAMDKIHPDDRDRLNRTLENCIRLGVDYQSEFRIIRYDGQIRWLLGKGRVFRSPEGQPLHMLGVNLDITDRKNAEAALVESEAKLRSSQEQLKLAIKQARVGFFDWEVQTGRVVFSQQMREDWGLPLAGDDLTFESAIALVHPDDRDRVEQLAMSAISRQESFQAEYRIIRPDGRMAWIEAAGVLILSDGGAAARLFGTCINITERKKFEESQRQIDEQLRVFAEAMPQMAFISDPEGNITYYNRRHYEYFGVKPGETEAWRWRDLQIHHPEDLARTIERWENSLRTGDPYQIEYRLKRHDGVYRWHLGRAEPVRDDTGAIRLWVGTNTDIDDQRKTLEALRESEEKFRLLTHELDHLLKEVEFERGRFEAVMKQMPAAVIIGEAPSGKLIFANEKMREVWGHDLLPSSEINDYATWIGYHPDGRRYEAKDWPLARSIAQGEIVDHEDVEIQRGDGARAILRLSSTPILDRNGKITAGVVICQDVTEMLDAIRSRDEFLSVCSHELKTPLTSLKLSLQSVLRNIRKGDPEALAPARASKMIEQTDRQVNRLVRLVDDMLDVSRIQIGKLSLELAPVCLSDLLQEVVARMEPMLTASVGPLVIERCDELHCMADPFRIEQVLVNLLTNAARYGNRKPVTVSLSREKDHWRLSVRDQGIGISPEDRERVFRRFERVVSFNDVSGLGLGLYICREIVESHHGRIWVEGAEPQGSVFLVEVPLNPGKTPERASGPTDSGSFAEG